MRPPTVLETWLIGKSHLLAIDKSSEPPQTVVLVHLVGSEQRYSGNPRIDYVLVTWFQNTVTESQSRDHKRSIDQCELLGYSELN
jgi:hypothetical protein